MSSTSSKSLAINVDESLVIKNKKCSSKCILYVVLFLILSGLYIVASFFFGTYMLASPKCPFGTMENDKAYLINDRCLLLYRSNSNLRYEIFTVHLADGNVTDRPCPTDLSNYCELQLAGFDYVAATGVGMMAMFLNISAWITIIVGTVFWPGVKLYKMGKQPLVAALFQICICTCVVFAWFYFIKFFFHDGENIKCRFFEKCPGNQWNCKDTDEYCYIDNFMFLQFQLLLVSIVSMCTIYLMAGIFGFIHYRLY